MFNLNVPDENDQPILFYDAGGKTQMAVVERDGVNGLVGDEFESACVYLLLDRHNTDGSWGLYIGQAKRAQNRLQSHQREKPDWYRALLILHPGRLEPNVMTSLWLERHLYEKLKDRLGIQMHNATVPQGNNELTAYQQQLLKSFTPTVIQALRLLGHDPDTKSVVSSAKSSGIGTTEQAEPAKTQEPAEPRSNKQASLEEIDNVAKVPTAQRRTISIPKQPTTRPAKPTTPPARLKPTPAKPTIIPARLKPTPAKPTIIPAKPKPTPAKPKPTPAKKRKLKYYGVKLAQIMQEGLLHEDARLTSTVPKYPAEAHLGRGGIVIYNGIKHDSPSAAGSSATGRSCNGWDFWAVIAADSPTYDQATLKEIRDIYIKRRDEGTLRT